MMASTNQDLKFQPQHRLALEKLLRPARNKCKQLCAALHLPYDSDGAGTKMDALYMIVIEAIINKGVSKRQLVAALRSQPVGHGNLAQEFENDESIKNNEDGKTIIIITSRVGLPPSCCTL